MILDIWPILNDDELIKLAKNDKRIIISRDEDLIRKAIKNWNKIYFIKNESEIEQFREIIKKSNLKIIKINGDRARCPNCNSQTQSIDKKKYSKKNSKSKF